MVMIIFEWCVWCSHFIFGFSLSFCKFSMFGWYMGGVHVQRFVSL